MAAETSWSDARLAIECPHPAGDPSLALLTLSNRSGPTTFVHKGVRELTVPRTDVELLISGLANRGYFDAAPDESGSAQLEIPIDQGRVDRAWINDTRLLDLARQTLVEGMPTYR